MDLGVDCRICKFQQWLWSTQIQGLSRAFYIKFQNFQGPSLFSTTFQVLEKLLFFQGLSRPCGHPVLATSLDSCNKLSKYGDRSFGSAGPRTWHSLPHGLRTVDISYKQKHICLARPRSFV